MRHFIFEEYKTVVALQRQTAKWFQLLHATERCNILLLAIVLVNMETNRTDRLSVLLSS